MSQYFKILQAIKKCPISVVPNLNRVLRIQCYSSQILAPVVGLGLGFQKCGHPCLNPFAVQRCRLSSEEPQSEHGCNLNFEELCKLKDEGEIILIDVRDPMELQEFGKLPDSINIPLIELESALQALSAKEFKVKYGIPKPTVDAPLVFSCAAGKRSQAALDIATKMGYKKARHYQGGFTDWKKKCNKD